MPTTEHIHLPLYTDEETPDLSTTGHYNHAMEILDANIGELEEKDAELAEDIADEREARIAGDTALEGKVAAETKAREAADAAITTSIGTKADSSALEKEVSDRKAADAATKNYVDTAIAAIPTGGSSAIALIDADTGTAAEIYAATQSAWPNCVLRHGEALYLPANRNDFGYGFFGTPCGTNVPGYAVNSVGADEYNVLNMTGRATWGQIEQS